jgi:hypothetical protein
VAATRHDCRRSIRLITHHTDVLVATRRCASPARCGAFVDKRRIMGRDAGGDLRWRPPMPATSWTATRKADAFAPACIIARGSICR